MDCKDWGKKKEKFGKGAKCKEKVKQKKSAGNCKICVKRQENSGKENFYENEVKRQQNSGKAKFGKAAAKCGARAKNHKGRTTCNASECEQLRQAPEGKKRATIPASAYQTGSARRENDNRNARR